MSLRTVRAVFLSRRSPPGAIALPLVAAALSLLLPATAGAVEAPSGWAIPLQSPYDAAKRSPAEALRCQAAAEAAAREAVSRYLRELPERQQQLESLRKENLEAWRQCARLAADGHFEGKQQGEARRKLLDAELECCTTLAQRAKALTSYGAGIEQWVKQAAAKPGEGSPESAWARAYRSDALLSAAREMRSFVPAEEIQSLQRSAVRHGIMFERKKALAAVGARGGETEQVTQAGYGYFATLADLCEACGAWDAALLCRRWAREMASQSVEALQVAYDVGTTTLDVLLEAFQADCDAERKLTQLARRLGVDPRGGAAGPAPTPAR